MGTGGTTSAGGLVGSQVNTATIDNCFSTGAVNSLYGTSGGLTGAHDNQYSPVRNSFWDTQTSGQSTSYYGIGKTTLQMKDVYSYLDASWDFVDETTNGTNNYWDDDANESLNNGYPVLSWQAGANGTLGPFYSGGSGTSGDPYLISSIEDLVYLSQHSVHWVYYFKQTSGITINVNETLVDWDGDGIADGSGTFGFSPIGNSTTKFTGTYDGQGHVINNLFINRTSSDYIGLFGVIWGGDILNLGLENIDFTGAGNVGGLVGNSGFSSNISNCFSKGTINASGNYVGGLVGTHSSTTTNNCYSRADVTGNANVGGFGGFVDYSTMNNCYSSGSVSGSSYVGGFIGYEENSGINNSFWDTESSGQSSSAGGIGKTIPYMTYYKTFTDAGWDFVTETTNGTNNYWDADQEGNVNDGYMILSWEDGADDIYRKYLTGNGTASEPYQIATTEDLLFLSLHSNDWDKEFVQVSHITFDSNPDNVDWDMDNVPEDLDDYVGFSPIGNSTTQFTGNYDGSNYYIANIFIYRGLEDFIGLFGYTNNASIEKVGLHNVDIYGSRYVGSLAGRALSSTISESYATGSVESNSATGDYTGGLVGVNSTTSITNCYSRATVIGGDDYTGGLVGLNNTSSSIDKCYSTGSVTGADLYVGGLVGSNSATVSDYSFWDKETSGQETSSGGIGKLTSEMKLNSTYLNAGWDSNIWNMDAIINNGYPYLDWVIPGGGELPVELNSFTILIKNNKVNLNWETATEVYNYGFEIERQKSVLSAKAEVSNQISVSRNQNSEATWETLGFVEGAGNSNSPKLYSFVDEDNLNGKYQYRLKQIDLNGQFKYSDVVEIEVNSLPAKFELAQNFPNPFNPSTAIRYALPTENTNVTLKIFDILGNEVATLVNEKQSAGYYQVTFNASQFASGVYIYRLQTSSGFVLTKKLMLLK